MRNNTFKSTGGLARIIKAGKYSMQGFKAAYTHEAAFRQELLLAAFLVPLAFFIAQSPLELALLLGTLILILIVELLNSSIEAVADAITHEPHPLIGRAKDIASAAVLLSFMLGTLVWLAIAYPLILRLFTA